MPKELIKLSSRYPNSPNFLKFIKKAESELAKDKFIYELKDADYVGFIIEPKPKEQEVKTLPTIISVDPPGGPFMSLGDTNIINGMKLTRINNTPEGVFLIFEKVDSISNN